MQAIIFMLASPIRSPVKDPGPKEQATAVISSLDTPASFIILSRCGISCSEWVSFLCTVHSLISLSFSASAQLNTNDDVSMASNILFYLLYQLLRSLFFPLDGQFSYGF